MKQKTGLRAGSQLIVDCGHYKTQSEHSTSLNLRTEFLNFIAFPQFVSMERFSNRVSLWLFGDRERTTTPPYHLEGSLICPARLPLKSVAHLHEVLASFSDFLNRFVECCGGNDYDSCIRSDQSQRGVGKSTSATNIAYGLVRLRRRSGTANCRVLLVDTDSQAHASLVTTGHKDYGVDNSLYTVLMADRKEAAIVLSNYLVQSTWDDDLHVLPPSPMLEGAERELTGVAGAPYRLAEPLSRIANHYAAIVIDTRPSFSLMTEMGLLAATDAIVSVEPRYLETVGLLSVISKINYIREGWRHRHLHVSGILVTKMDTRVKGHKQLLDELKSHSVLGQLLCGVIPADEAVSYSHHHLSVFN